ncbi:NAD(P)/FAD-dependent oxidoreductase [Haladaptatus sp. NG-SE-30]
MRVVVVGGGIVGCASAYYLADRGAEVVVCERSNVGAGSTERSAGGIRAQFSTPVNVALSQASMQVWNRFEAAFDTDIAYRRSGYLFLAREEATAEGFADTVSMQNEQGVPSELLTPAEAREHCPGLRDEEFRAATYSPTDGFADPHLALQGFARAAREAGAEIRTGVEVTNVRREEGAVVGVETTENRIAADFVVNATGPWAQRVAELAGIDLPVAPERRQIAVVEPETPVPEPVPLTIDLDTGSYFRPEREGAALVGGHFGRPSAADPDAYDTTTDLDWTVEALERVSEWTTYFGPESRIKRGWAGLYAVTPDHHPIIEETIPGFVNAVGFSGHGFQHAPATGQLVAELIFDEKPSLVDISGLDSARFAEGRTVEERNVA